MAQGEVYRIMLDRGYVHADTGGGCTAYAKEEADCVWLVTSMESETQVPERMDEPVLVGKYTKDWDYIEGHDRVHDSLRAYLDGKEGKAPEWLKKDDI